MNAPEKNTIDILRQLVAFGSVSNQSNCEISQFLADWMRQRGFEISLMSYRDAKGIEKCNVVGKLGKGTGGLAYFCHSDVVPADDWSRPHSPFELTVEGDRVYGRGACDMKGSAACMLQAAASVDVSEFRAPLYFICTADEEIGFGGAKHFVARSPLYQELITSKTPVIIGEPTQLNVVHSHKGMVVMRITSKGRAAHSSTTEGVNANVAMIPFLVEMRNIWKETTTDAMWQNAAFDPPHISWNIGINDFTPAVNITPAQSVCTVSFRPMPNQEINSLLERAAATAEGLGLTFTVEANSRAVYTAPNRQFVRTALKLTNSPTSRTVSYGTDGCELVDLPDKIICGPGDIAQAHTNNESISVDQLRAGRIVFERFIRHYCSRET